MGGSLREVALRAAGIASSNPTDLTIAVGAAATAVLLTQDAAKEDAAAAGVDAARGLGFGSTSDLALVRRLAARGGLSKADRPRKQLSSPLQR